VAVAEQLYWSLLEGKYQGDRTPTANQLRETLSDITAQWEMLLGNLHDQHPLASLPEFPSEWVQQWLEQIQSIEQTTPCQKHPKSTHPRALTPAKVFSADEKSHHQSQTRR
jgi:hypothetical protein